MPDTDEPIAPIEASNHDARIEYLERREYEIRHAKVRRADKRLLVLYGVLGLAFVLLAYRTEVNDRNLRYGLHDACEARVSAAQSGNQLRDVFLQALATSPRQAPDARTPEEQAALIEQLKGVLFLPLEDCGPDPRQ